MLEPLLTLDRLYPPGAVLSGRPSPHAARFLRGDAALRDFLAAEPLAIAGAMPVLCGSGSLAPQVAELVAASGLEVRAAPLAFADAADYLERLAELARGGRRFALSHPHRPGEIPDEAYCVPRDLLLRLNNKRSLGELVPEENRPHARLVPAARFAELLDGPDEEPVVIKAAVDEPTGGGTSVRICRTRGERGAALADLADVPELLVERFVPHRASFNVQVAIPARGAAAGEEPAPIYLGASEQVVTLEGRYRGNWVSPGDPSPEGARDLALAIAARAARQGYAGLAGFDLAADERGRLVVFDANFRLNGSTPALLLAPALARRGGAAALRYRTFLGERGFAAAVTVLGGAVASGWLVALNGFDPARSRDPAARPWFTAVVLGADRAEVAAREAELAAAGLV